MGPISEARSVAQTPARPLGAEQWVQKIEEWMQNSQGLFLNYRVEYAALSINASRFAQNCRIGSLDVELTESTIENR